MKSQFLSEVVFAVTLRLPSTTLGTFSVLTPVVGSMSVNEEKLTIIQNQKEERIWGGECAEDGSLPLCYSSFELIRQRLKASKQN